MDKEKPVQEVQDGLSIGELSRLTGAPEATLRMWERRHDLLRPARLPGGHRRYRPADVDLVQQVLAARAAGLSLSAAAARARQHEQRPALSIYATLRRRRPDLVPQRLTREAMLALSRAIEEESLARAERPVLFGAFQRERFFRRSQGRWRQLAAGARFSAVFADFPRAATPQEGPAEIPLSAGHPLMREWAVVSDGEAGGACLFGWEPPRDDRGPRLFEAVWSVEPDVVREAARICGGIASGHVGLPREVAGLLEGEAATVAVDQLRLATAVTARALGHLVD
jgi:DNA-binding transcriptional MerR regulator